jgi:UTP---glucose-1-phosphate uridylyltransferase
VFVNDLQKKQVEPFQADQKSFPRLQHHTQNAQRLLEKLAHNPKLETLLSARSVQEYFKERPDVKEWFCALQNELTQKEQFAFVALLALEQGDVLFPRGEELPKKESFKKTLAIVSAAETFYKPLGGIIGYHKKVLELVEAQLEKKPIEEDVSYSAPPVFDVRTEKNAENTYIRQGIEALPQMAELYAVGGAGDRLQLIDEKTRQPLPAARLEFLAKTLFELLVADLEAREYLYYKLYGKDIICPIVLMTSEEKMNHSEIENLCEKANWFKRGKEHFRFIVQPVTPVISQEGTWAIQGPAELLLKPGGHGVIWKLAKDAEVFDWLLKEQKTALIVRQINNPLAGLDATLLTLFGYGIGHNMSFGFASCPRRENAQEGMNVLKKKNGRYTISNLEYTEFSRLKNHEFQASKCPANTNILFAQIDAVSEAVEKDPIPGMLVNMKLPVHTILDNKRTTLLGARLESTMQNIADVFSSPTKEQLPVFITLNDREKTISVAKKAYTQDASIFETPEGAFFDLLQANYALLKDYCQVEMKEFGSEGQYMQYGPSYLFTYHPALGPLYRIIGQKIRSGKIAQGSELELKIAELDLENFSLDGSLSIESECITAKMNNQEHTRQFSEQVGRARLKNCTIKNKGIDRTCQNCYWKKQIARKECFKIKLDGDSEFVAENIIFEGAYEFVIPHGMRGTAVMAQDGVHLLLEPIRGQAWHWNYAFDENNDIRLTKHVK